VSGDIDIPEGAEVTFRMVPEKFVIVFNSGKNKEIGRLTENDDGQLVFQGDTMESAAVFFDAVVALNSSKIKELTNGR